MDPRPSPRALSRLLIAFGISVLAASTLAGDHGLAATLHARRQSQELSADISALRHLNHQLRLRVAALQSDPAAIEAVAREELGLARPDELVIMKARQLSPQ